MERRKGRSLVRRIFLWPHYLLSGYWERPLRALSVLVLIRLLFAALYAGVGLPLQQDGSFLTRIMHLPSYGHTLAYSAGNLTLQGTAPKPEDVMGNGARLLQNLVTVERIPGLLQIGFLALSLRRQFMR